MVYGTYDLSLDEISPMDQQRKYSNHGNNLINSNLAISNDFAPLPQIVSPMIYFITDAIFHFQKHSLTLSPLLSCSLPTQFIWYKSSGFHFQFISDHFTLIQFTSLFHLEAAHNNGNVQ
jgi:hypothetical protein